MPKKQKGKGIDPLSAAIGNYLGLTAPTRSDGTSLDQPPTAAWKAQWGHGIKKNMTFNEFFNHHRKMGVHPSEIDERWQRYKK